jgi:hypothetical protein
MGLTDWDNDLSILGQARDCRKMHQIAPKHPPVPPMTLANMLWIKIKNPDAPAATRVVEG